MDPHLAAPHPSKRSADGQSIDAVRLVRYARRRKVRILPGAVPRRRMRRLERPRPPPRFTPLVSQADHAPRWGAPAHQRHRLPIRATPGSSRRCFLGARARGAADLPTGHGPRSSQLVLLCATLWASARSRPFRRSPNPVRQTPAPTQPPPRRPGGIGAQAAALETAAADAFVTVHAASEGPTAAPRDPVTAQRRPAPRARRGRRTGKAGRSSMGPCTAACLSTCAARPARWHVRFVPYPPTRGHRGARLDRAAPAAECPNHPGVSAAASGRGPDQRASVRDGSSW